MILLLSFDKRRSESHFIRCVVIKENMNVGGTQQRRNLSENRIQQRLEFEAGTEQQTGAVNCFQFGIALILNPLGFFTLDQFAVQPLIQITDRADSEHKNQDDDVIEQLP